MKIFFKNTKKYSSIAYALPKIFNKNTIKVSYSCKRNIKSIIKSHNKQILTSQIIYQADVTENLDDEHKYYLGLAETTFKERYGNHKSSFKNENSKSSAELSKYV